jgi:sporulation protein YlmC with PRC-barrel domain
MPIDETARLAGLPVRSSDGHDLGRVSTIHVPDGQVRPLLVQIDTGTPTEPVVPVVDARIERGELVVPYERRQILDGPAVSGPKPLTLGDVAFVVERYRIGRVEVAGRDLGETAPGVGDVGAEDPDVEKLPPVVIIRPGITARTAGDGAGG